jgi:hypothetical protein
MPNNQELLESSNRAAAEGWVPPELRQAREWADSSGNLKANVKVNVEEVQHGN